ncbi:hypothetical protein QQ054_23625 [Oscillatoria amoena NRMC-F 0135]|nr:hypothetical protein [Oscillatoria amoena NRMC-F 0135]
MKLKLIVISFLLLSQAAFAQTDDELKPEHQIGVNATLFIKQFLSFNNTIAGSSPFLVTYKYIESNQGWRIGVGGSNATTKNNSNTIFGASSNSSLLIDTRLGYEWQKGLDKRWLLYYGVDAVYSYSKFRFTTNALGGGFPQKIEEVISSNEGFSAGGGPILGVEFKISKRIRLNAETTAYATYSETRRREINTQFIGFERNDYSASSRMFITVPTSIFFIINI